MAKFSLNLLDNIACLHQELKNKTYSHGGYQSFRINDPKPRNIHKASVRDRLVHHAVYRILYPCFDKKFVFDSYSCRLGKGTHKTIYRLRHLSRIVSKNNTKTCWILQCDVRKFFATIDHGVLKNILAQHLADEDAQWLLAQVIDSYNEGEKIGTGLPLGNLTSQLFVNIYMNEFDHYVKRVLKQRYYIRYADDFIIIHEDKKYLESLLPKTYEFLENKLKLTLHPKKVSLNTFNSGIDYLGWVHFSHYRVLRTTTKRRMIKKLSNNPSLKTKASYLGLVSHGNTYNLQQKLFKED